MASNNNKKYNVRNSIPGLDKSDSASRNNINIKESELLKMESNINTTINSEELKEKLKKQNLELDSISLKKDRDEFEENINSKTNELENKTLEAENKFSDFYLNKVSEFVEDERYKVEKSMDLMNLKDLVISKIKNKYENKKLNNFGDINSETLRLPNDRAGNKQNSLRLNPDYYSIPRNNFIVLKDDIKNPIIIASFQALDVTYRDSSYLNSDLGAFQAKLIIRGNDTALDLELYSTLLSPGKYGCAIYSEGSYNGDNDLVLGVYKEIGSQNIIITIKNNNETNVNTIHLDTNTSIVLGDNIDLSDEYSKEFIVDYNRYVLIGEALFKSEDGFEYGPKNTELKDRYYSSKDLNERTISESDILGETNIVRINTINKDIEDMNIKSFPLTNIDQIKDSKLNDKVLFKDNKVKFYNYNKYFKTPNANLEWLDTVNEIMYIGTSDGLVLYKDGEKLVENHPEFDGISIEKITYSDYKKTLYILTSNNELFYTNEKDSNNIFSNFQKYEINENLNCIYREDTQIKTEGFVNLDNLLNDDKKFIKQSHLFTPEEMKIMDFAVIGSDYYEDTDRECEIVNQSSALEYSEENDDNIKGFINTRVGDNTIRIVLNNNKFYKYVNFKEVEMIEFNSLNATDLVAQCMFSGVVNDETIYGVIFDKAIFYSTDLETWTEVTMPTTGLEKEWVECKYVNFENGGKFVAITTSKNDTHRVMLSEDGKTWYTKEVPENDAKWNYMDSGYIAGEYNKVVLAIVSSEGIGDRVMISTDGETFTVKDLKWGGYIKGIKYIESNYTEENEIETLVNEEKEYKFMKRGFVVYGNFYAGEMGMFYSVDANNWNKVRNDINSSSKYGNISIIKPLNDEEILRYLKEFSPDINMNEISNSIGLNGSIGNKTYLAFSNVVSNAEELEKGKLREFSIPPNDRCSLNFYTSFSFNKEYTKDINLGKEITDLLYGDGSPISIDDYKSYNIYFSLYSVKMKDNILSGVIENVNKRIDGIGFMIYTNSFNNKEELINEINAKSAELCYDLSPDEVNTLVLIRLSFYRNREILTLSDNPTVDTEYLISSTKYTKDVIDNNYINNMNPEYSYYISKKSEGGFYNLVLYEGIPEFLGEEFINLEDLKNMTFSKFFGVINDAIKVDSSTIRNVIATQEGEFYIYVYKKVEEIVPIVSSTISPIILASDYSVDDRFCVEGGNVLDFNQLSKVSEPNDIYNLKLDSSIIDSIFEVKIWDLYEKGGNNRLILSIFNERLEIFNFISKYYKKSIQKEYSVPYKQEVLILKLWLKRFYHEFPENIVQQGWNELNSSVGALTSHQKIDSEGDNFGKLTSYSDNEFLFPGGMIVYSERKAYDGIIKENTLHEKFILLNNTYNDDREFDLGSVDSEMVYISKLEGIDKTMEFSFLENQHPFQKSLDLLYCDKEMKKVMVAARGCQKFTMISSDKGNSSQWTVDKIEEIENIEKFTLNDNYKEDTYVNEKIWDIIVKYNSGIGKFDSSLYGITNSIFYENDKLYITFLIMTHTPVLISKCINDNTINTIDLAPIFITLAGDFSLKPNDVITYIQKFNNHLILLSSLDLFESSYVSDINEAMTYIMSKNSGKYVYKYKLYYIDLNNYNTDNIESLEEINTLFREINLNLNEYNFVLGLNSSDTINSFYGLNNKNIRPYVQFSPDGNLIALVAKNIVETPEEDGSINMFNSPDFYIIKMNLNGEILNSVMIEKKALDVPEGYPFEYDYVREFEVKKDGTIVVTCMQRIGIIDPNTFEIRYMDFGTIALEKSKQFSISNIEVNGVNHSVYNLNMLRVDTNEDLSLIVVYSFYYQYNYNTFELNFNIGGSDSLASSKIEIYSEGAWYTVDTKTNIENKSGFTDFVDRIDGVHITDDNIIRFIIKRIKIENGDLVCQAEDIYSNSIYRIDDFKNNISIVNESIEISDSDIKSRYITGFKNFINGYFYSENGYFSQSIFTSIDKLKKLLPSYFDSTYFTTNFQSFINKYSYGKIYYETKTTEVENIYTKDSSNFVENRYKGLTAFRTYGEGYSILNQHDGIVWVDKVNHRVYDLRNIENFEDLWLDKHTDYNDPIYNLKDQPILNVIPLHFIDGVIVSAKRFSNVYPDLIDIPWNPNQELMNLSDYVFIEVFYEKDDSRNHLLLIHKNYNFGFRVRECEVNTFLSNTSTDNSKSLNILSRQGIGDKNNTFMYKVLEATGMPYDVPCKAHGFVIIEGKQIPVEAIKLTRPFFDTGNEREGVIGGVELLLDRNLLIESDLMNVNETNVESPDLVGNMPALSLGPIDETGKEVGQIRNAFYSNLKVEARMSRKVIDTNGFTYISPRSITMPFRVITSSNEALNNAFNNKLYSPNILNGIVMSYDINNNIIKEEYCSLYKKYSQYMNTGYNYSEYHKMLFIGVLNVINNKRFLVCHNPNTNSDKWNEIIIENIDSPDVIDRLFSCGEYIIASIGVYEDVIKENPEDEPTTEKVLKYGYYKLEFTNTDTKFNKEQFRLVDLTASNSYDDFINVLNSKTRKYINSSICEIYTTGEDLKRITHYANIDHDLSLDNGEDSEICGVYKNGKHVLKLEKDSINNTLYTGELCSNDVVIVFAEPDTEHNIIYTSVDGGNTFNKATLPQATIIKQIIADVENGIVILIPKFVTEKDYKVLITKNSGVTYEIMDNNNIIINDSYIIFNTKVYSKNLYRYIVSYNNNLSQTEFWGKVDSYRYFFYTNEKDIEISQGATSYYYLFDPVSNYVLQSMDQFNTFDEYIIGSGIYKKVKIFDNNKSIIYEYEDEGVNKCTIYKNHNSIVLSSIINSDGFMEEVNYYDSELRDCTISQVDENFYLFKDGEFVEENDLFMHATKLMTSKFSKYGNPGSESDTCTSHPISSLEREYFILQISESDTVHKFYKIKTEKFINLEEPIDYTDIPNIAECEIEIEGTIELGAILDDTQVGVYNDSYCRIPPIEAYYDEINECYILPIVFSEKNTLIKFNKDMTSGKVISHELDDIGHNILLNGQVLRIPEFGDKLCLITSRVSKTDVPNTNLDKLLDKYYSQFPFILFDSKTETFEEPNIINKDEFKELFFYDADYTTVGYEPGVDSTIVSLNFSKYPAITQAWYYNNKLYLLISSDCGKTSNNKIQHILEISFEQTKFQIDRTKEQANLDITGKNINRVVQGFDLTLIYPKSLQNNEPTTANL